MSRRIALLACPIAIAFMLLSDFASRAEDKPGDDPALKRTRRTVRMLDDIYKGGIVAITTHYVNDEQTIPAGTAFKQIFKTAEEKGWHKVRLVDATGQPLNDENAPEDNFEKQAMKKLVAGTAWHEKVVVESGQRKLRVATPIPVVFDKCVMCHDHYADVKTGQAIGGLVYEIPVE